MFHGQIAGKHGRDLLRAIQRDVHGEVDAGHPRNLADIVVDRIAFGDAPRRVRVADPAGVVQDEHGFESGQARRHHLRSAAEPGEEMWLDEAGRDADVGVHPGAIQVHGHIGLRLPHEDEARRIPAVVVDDAIVAEDVGAEHRLELRGRVGAMRTGGDENRDVVRPHVGHLGEERLEHLAAWLRPRDITDGDRHTLPGPDEVAERLERRAGSRTLL